MVVDQRGLGWVINRVMQKNRQKSTFFWIHTEHIYYKGVKLFPLLKYLGLCLIPRKGSAITAEGVLMNTIISTLSYDELETKTSIKIKGHIYNKIPGMKLFVNKNGNIVQYNKSGAVTAKPIYKNQFGYEYIHYCYDTYFVHRLVALAFGLLDKYDYSPDCEVDHINDIRNDNRLCNLQVLSKLDNLAKRKKTTNKKYRISKDDVVYEFNTKTECAQWLIDNKYSKGTLQHTKENLARNRLTHYGFEYEEIR